MNFVDGRRGHSLYVITAWTPDGIVQQTRITAASAVVLAKKWREAGRIVEVKDPMGNLLTDQHISATILAQVSERGGPR